MAILSRIMSRKIAVATDPLAILEDALLPLSRPFKPTMSAPAVTIQMPETITKTQNIALNALSLATETDTAPLYLAALRMATSDIQINSTAARAGAMAVARALCKLSERATDPRKGR